MKLTKTLSLITLLAIFSTMVVSPEAFAWPFKKDKKQTAQKVYPLGPDANGFYTSSSGLKFKDMTKGKGQRPRIGQTAVVHYTGRLTNGKKFDSSLDRGQPFTFVLGKGQVIKGWDEGVRGMNIGGKRRLVVPPHLGYGSRGAGGVIPPNATLIFDVELLGVR